MGFGEGCIGFRNEGGIDLREVGFLIRVWGVRDYCPVLTWISAMAFNYDCREVFRLPYGHWPMYNGRAHLATQKCQIHSFKRKKHCERPFSVSILV